MLTLDCSVFLPIGDRNEHLLFPGTGWNLFLCWMTKNSQQWFHLTIITKMTMKMLIKSVVVS